ncbi:MAG: hypothetical protein FWC78_09100 [Defluviitaleaceae bacterium]|nr:hypothetical protein [Defluviitaleaceae bacterium]
MSYERIFLALGCETRGYEFKGRAPMGRCIVECRGEAGKVSLLVQNLKPEVMYNLCLVFEAGSRFAGVHLCWLHVDDRGKGEVKLDVSGHALHGFNLADIAAVAVVTAGQQGVASPLCGYRAEAFAWRGNFYFVEADDGSVQPQIATASVMDEESMDSSCLMQDKVADGGQASVIASAASDEVQAEGDSLPLDAVEDSSLAIPLSTGEPQPENIIPSPDEVNGDLPAAPLAEKEPPTENSASPQHNSEDDCLVTPLVIEETQVENHYPVAPLFVEEPQAESPPQDKTEGDCLAAPFVAEEPTTDSRSLKKEKTRKLNPPKPQTTPPTAKQNKPLKPGKPKKPPTTNPNAFRSAVQNMTADLTPHLPETETLQQIFNANPPIIPFTNLGHNISWVKLASTQNTPTPINRPNLFTEPFVLAAFGQHEHIILGLASDMQKYIIGLPSHYTPEDRKHARRLGFGQFKCTETEHPARGEFGYWLMLVSM